MPGAPVLQNAWATPGIVGAINYGRRGTDRYTRAPCHGRLRPPLSVQWRCRRSLADLAADREVGVWRASWRFRLEAARRARSASAHLRRVGGRQSSRQRRTRRVAITLRRIPVGVAIGWRNALGATRGDFALRDAVRHDLLPTGDTCQGMRVAPSAHASASMSESRRQLGATVGV